MTIASVRLEARRPHRADDGLERPVRSLAVPPVRDAEDGRGRTAALKASVFAQSAETQRTFYPILPQIGDARFPAVP